MSRYICKCAILVVLAGPLGSCALVASVVPKDGPTGEAVRSESQTTPQQPAARLPYAFVNLEASVMPIVNGDSDESSSLGGFFHGRKPKAKAPIGVGDVVAITVFEAQAGGLFLPSESVPRQGNFVPMPNQQVDAGGKINIPFGGEVRLAGLTADEAGKQISKSLAKRAIEPQAVVSIVERRSGEINVLGEVGAPTRFFLDPGGIHVLGALARAGGSKFPAFESVVTIQRGGQTRRVMLSSIIKKPELNVDLEPGDSVMISHRPKFYMAFGATNLIQAAAATSKLFPFESEEMTLAQGLARSAGLDSTRADPRAVFLMRLEKRSTLERLGVDTSHYPEEFVPTVYSVDLSAADGFFLMNSIKMRHSDMIVASDSPTSDFTKLTGVIQSMAAPGYNVKFMAQ